MRRSNKETLQLIERNDPEIKVVSFHTYEIGDYIDDIDMRDEEIPGVELIKKVVDALNKNTFVTSLSFNMSYIGDDCALELGRIRCPTLTELSLQKNKFTSKGIIEIAKIPHLKILNVSYNGIDDEGAVALSAMQSLTELSLRKNNFTSKGIKEIAKMPHLKILNVSYNGIDDEGAVALSTMESLEKLNISFNQVGNHGLIALLKNTRIKKLKIEGNAFNTAGLQHVFNNSTLFSIRARNHEVSLEYHQKVLDHVSANEHPPKSKCSIQ